MKKVSVVVIDGVTVGHPCCGVPRCTVPLRNNHSRFCPDHDNENQVCAVVGCSDAVMPEKRTCSHPTHQAVEDYHNTRGHARFQLKDRLERSRLAHPNDAVAQEAASISELLTDDDHNDEFNMAEVLELIPAPSPLDFNNSTDGKVRAKFGRTRTHNEQLFVLPCGIIVARETFYHAEGLYSVIVRGISLTL